MLVGNRCDGCEPVNAHTFRKQFNVLKVVRKNSPMGIDFTGSLVEFCRCNLLAPGGRLR